jgi:iron complex transport system substrate-binding protein
MSASGIPCAPAKAGAQGSRRGAHGSGLLLSQEHYALAALFLLATPSAAAGPRLVSINPCVDAVLMRVADPDQIAGISHYSQDPQATSIPIALADRFKATSGTAEEVVALRPDMVLTGPHVAPSTIQALKRMRIRLVQYDVPQTLGENAQQVRDIARIAGHPDRGEALVRQIERAVAAARPAPGTKPVPALIWEGEGLVPGAGTLADDLLTRTGFINQSAAYGLKQWDVLPLEYLIARPPRVIFSVAAAEGRADRMTAHPALARLRRFATIAPYPERLLHCAGPTLIDAATRLAQVRRMVQP